MNLPIDPTSRIAVSSNMPGSDAATAQDQLQPGGGVGRASDAAFSGEFVVGLLPLAIVGLIAEFVMRRRRRRAQEPWNQPLRPSLGVAHLGVGVVAG